MPRTGVPEVVEAAYLQFADLRQVIGLSQEQIVKTVGIKPHDSSPHFGYAWTSSCTTFSVKTPRVSATGTLAMK